MPLTPHIPTRAALATFVLVQWANMLELALLSLVHSPDLTSLLWALCGGFTVGLPIALLMAGAGGWTTWTWCLHTLDPLAPEWSARLLAALPLGAMTIGIAAALGPRVLETIRTPWMAAVSITLIVIVASAALTALLAPWCIRTAAHMIAASRAHTDILARPMRVSLALIALALCGFTAIAALQWDLVRQTPWWSPVAWLVARASCFW